MENNLTECGCCNKVIDVLHWTSYVIITCNVCGITYFVCNSCCVKNNYKEINNQKCNSCKRNITLNSIIS